jgi:hypothetical protein
VIIHLVRPKYGSLCHRELVRAFADPTAAEEYARDLERRGVVPPGVNPFLSVSWSGCRLAPRAHYPKNIADRLDVRRVTSFPEPILHDWVLDCGLTPPSLMTIRWLTQTESGRQQVRDWFGWWQDHDKRMTELQRTHIRRALDKVQLFEVIPLELEE